MRLLKFDLVIAQLKWARIQQYRRHASFLNEVRKRVNTATVQRTRAHASSAHEDATLWLAPEETTEFRDLEAKINTYEAGKKKAGQFAPKTELERALDQGWTVVPPTTLLPSSEYISPADIIHIQPAEPVGVDDMIDTGYAAIDVQSAWEDHVAMQEWLRDKGEEYDQSVFGPVNTPEQVDNAIQEDDSLESILARTAGCEG